VLQYDWQSAATVACIVLAAIVVVRRLWGLFSPSGGAGCQSGGCGSCPSRTAGGTGSGSADFVPLESLVASTHGKAAGPTIEESHVEHSATRTGR